MEEEGKKGFYNDKLCGIIIKLEGNTQDKSIILLIQGAEKRI